MLFRWLSARVKRPQAAAAHGDPELAAARLARLESGFVVFLGGPPETKKDGFAGKEPPRASNSKEICACSVYLCVCLLVEGTFSGLG